jgi:hypothetical protein
VLLGWWAWENTRRRHLWPGINVGRIRGARGAEEVVDQILVTRGRLPDGPGNVHWSIGSLARSDTLATAVLDGPYLRQALVPASPWLDARTPAAPSVSAEPSVPGVPDRGATEVAVSAVDRVGNESRLAFWRMPR